MTGERSGWLPRTSWAGIRLPYAPLARYVALNYDQDTYQPPPWDELPEVAGPTQVALVAGVGFHAVMDWRDRGVPLFAADNVAISFNTHPALIWPEWFDLELTLPDEWHGTPQGYRWHRRYQVPTCEPCREAARPEEREKMRARRAA